MSPEKHNTDNLRERKITVPLSERWSKLQQRLLPVAATLLLNSVPAVAQDPKQEDLFHNPNPVTNINKSSIERESTKLLPLPQVVIKDIERLGNVSSITVKINQNRELWVGNPMGMLNEPSVKSTNIILADIAQGFIDYGIIKQKSGIYKSLKSDEAYLTIHLSNDAKNNINPSQNPLPNSDQKSLW